MISVERGRSYGKDFAPEAHIITLFRLIVPFMVLVVVVSLAGLVVPVPVRGLATFAGNFTLFLGVHGSKTAVRCISQGGGLAPFTGYLSLLCRVHRSEPPAFSLSPIVVFIFGAHMDMIKLFLIIKQNG